MKADVWRVVEDCGICENEKGKRNLAHGLFSSNTTTKPLLPLFHGLSRPRSRHYRRNRGPSPLDSFKKNVIVIPLLNRQITTPLPRLLDALHFRRGSPDVINSDDAPEFLSDLMTAVAAVTSTQRTTTCGHNPQSNSEIESWWSYWNRVMRYSPPSQYLNWPSCTQRIVFAYNSVPHESIDLTRWNLPHLSSPRLACQIPTSTSHLENTSVSPESFVDALRVSVQAFHAFAASHKSFMATTSQDRLNKHGTPHTFSIHDRVKIYVPPTHAQLLRTGRRSNHIVSWQGPCRITKILSPSSYEMEEECSGRKFQRSIINTRPFHTFKNPPLPHHDLVSHAALHPGTTIAVRDTPTSHFYLAKVKKITESLLSVHYLGTSLPTQPWTSRSSVFSGSRPTTEL
jgi:hypothetical protein